MTFFPQISQKTFVIEKKCIFVQKKLRLKKSEGKNFKQQVFRPTIDNTLYFSLTVTVTIYKVLWPKRLKIAVIKEQHSNAKIEATKKDWMDKTFARREFSVIS